MMRVLQTSLVLLALVGFLFQGIWAGAPAGQSLCIGCEREDNDWRWDICEPCIPGVRDCCDDVQRSDECSDCPLGSSAQTPSSCNCIDIPLIGGMPTLLSAPVRADSFFPAVVQDTFPNTPAVCAQWAYDLHSPAYWARAGPMWRDGAPPRLLAPIARWTVLTI